VICVTHNTLFLNDQLKVNVGFNKMLNSDFVGNIDYGNGFASLESNGSRQNIQLRVAYSFGAKFRKETRIETKKTELMTPIKRLSIYYVHTIKNLSDCSKGFGFTIL